MTGRNIASLCWEDHLVFGEGDGRLATADALRRRLERWRDDLDAGIVHWRCREIGVPVHFMTADGYESRVLSRRLDAEMEEFEVMPRLVRDAGLEAYLESNDNVRLIYDENAHAHRLGINGVPSFAFNDKFVISGAQEPQVLERVLDAAMAADAA